MIIITMDDNIKPQIINNFKQSYEQNDFDAALSILKENRQAFDPAIWFYNRGLIGLKNENYSVARYYFEKAKMGGFYSNEVIEAIEVSKDKLGLMFYEEDDSGYDIFMHTSFSINQDSYIATSLLFLILIVWKFKHISSIFLKTSLTLLALIPMIYGVFYIGRHDLHISLDTVNVYEGPSKMFETVEEMPEGLFLITAKESNGWRFVVYPEKFKGWIFTKQLGTL